MRCGVCGLTIVEERPFDGSEEKTWQLDEPDYGPDGSHAVIQGELGIGTKTTQPAQRPARRTQH